MLSFIEWLYESKSKKRIKNDPKSNRQGSSEVGLFSVQGETDRNDQKIISNDVLYLAEP